MRSKLLAEVIQMYLADKQGEITDEVMKAKARTFDGFLAFFEDDALTVVGLDREQPSQIVFALRRFGYHLRQVGHSKGPFFIGYIGRIRLA
jgi:hypothetical protein